MVETITVKEPHRLPQVVELRVIPSLRSVMKAGPDGATLSGRYLALDAREPARFAFVTPTGCVEAYDSLAELREQRGVAFAEEDINPHLFGKPLVESVHKVLAAIREDQADGSIPPRVGSFAALHDYVDANGYFDLLDWEIPDDDDGFVDYCNAVSDVVDTILWREASTAVRPSQVESAVTAFLMRETECVEVDDGVCELHDIEYTDGVCSFQQEAAARFMEDVLRPMFPTL